MKPTHILLSMALLLALAAVAHGQTQASTDQANTSNSPQTNAPATPTSQTPQPVAAAADNQNPPPDPGDMGTPFKLTAGPQADGSLGLTLKGDRFFTSNKLRFRATRSGFGAPYAAISSDIVLNGAEDKPDQSAVSFQPGLFFGGFWPGFRPVAPVADIYLDVRGRFGEFQQQDETFTNVNQLLYGATLRIQVPGAYALLDKLDALRPAGAAFSGSEVPYLSVTYYRVHDTSETEQPLPDAITANKLVARLSGSLLVPYSALAFGTNSQAAALKLSYDLSATKAIGAADRKWHRLVDIALYPDNDAKAKPVIRYSNGAKEGFQYDKQLIAGILLQLTQ